MKATTAGHPDIGYIVLCGDNSYKYCDIPATLENALGELADEETDIGSIAVAPSGGWIMLTESGGYRHEGLDHALASALEELHDRDAAIHDVSFSPQGEWVIIFDDCCYWTSDQTADSLLAALSELSEELDSNDGDGIHQVAFAGRDSWVVFYNSYRYWAKNIPLSLQDAIEEVSKKRLFLKHVSFTSDGGWVLFYGRNGRRLSDIPGNVQEAISGAREPHTIAFPVQHSSASESFDPTDNFDYLETNPAMLDDPNEGYW